jgi:hypothetical protein
MPIKLPFKNIMTYRNAFRYILLIFYRSTLKMTALTPSKREKHLPVDNIT